MKNFILSIVGLFLLSSPLPSQANKNPKYNNPTGREFPILAWYSIMPDSNLTRERYQEMRNAGFNISFSHFNNTEQLTKGLKACRGTGVKILVICPELYDKTQATITKFKNDKNIAGWFLRDEPVVRDFESLRELRDSVYKADQKHVVYLNLLPSIVNPSDLGTKDYEEYVQRFVDEVNISQISYDFYPVANDNGHVYLRLQFYENLEIVRRVAQRTQQPFWAFALSTAHGPYPIPTSVHMRIEALSALAYGAQCIQYFTYWTPETTTWNFHNAPIDENGNRTDVYYRIKNLNWEIQNLAYVFLGAISDDVAHTGAQIPQGTKQLTTMPRPFSNISSDGPGVLVSQLHNGHKRYIMIMNRDIDKTQLVSVKKNRRVWRILPDGSKKKEKPGENEQVTLAPSDYLLYQI